MIQRLVLLHKSVTRVLHTKENEQYLDKNLSDEEIIELKEVCEVLKCFYLITEKMSGEKYPTLSIILPSIEILKKTVILLKYNNF